MDSFHFEPRKKKCALQFEGHESMNAMKTQNVICVLHPHVAIRDPISTFSAQIHQTPCPLLVRDIGDLRNANGIAFSYLVP